MGGGKEMDTPVPAKKEEVVINLRDDKGYAHEAYKRRAGFLSKEDYRTVLDRAREYQRGTISTSAQEQDPLPSVQKMLNHLDVHKQFGTNDKQEVFLYQAFKDFLHEHPEAVNRYQDNEHVIMTDEQVLAEAYKILGDESSLALLEQLKKRNRHPQVR